MGWEVTPGLGLVRNGAVKRIYSGIRAGKNGAGKILEREKKFQGSHKAHEALTRNPAWATGRHFRLLVL